MVVLYSYITYILYPNAWGSDIVINYNTAVFYQGPHGMEMKGRAVAYTRENHFAYARGGRRSLHRICLPYETSAPGS